MSGRGGWDSGVGRSGSSDGSTMITLPDVVMSEESLGASGAAGGAVGGATGRGEEEADSRRTSLISQHSAPGFLQDAQDQTREAFEMGIPLPALYERVSPAGAPPEGPTDAVYPTASQNKLNELQTLGPRPPSANGRRTSLQIVANVASSRRASLQVSCLSRDQVETLSSSPHRSNHGHKSGGHHHHHRHHHHHNRHHHHHHHSPRSSLTGQRTLAPAPALGAAPPPQPLQQPHRPAYASHSHSHSPGPGPSPSHSPGPSLQAHHHSSIGSISRFSAWKPTAGDQPMYDGPDLPAADLPEDHEGLEPTPLPVDVSKINVKVTGYDTPSQQRTAAVGPPTTQPTLSDLEKSGFNVPTEKFLSFPEISKEEAKEAIENFANSHYCYANKVARDLHIVKVTPCTTLRYALDTFTEERHTSWEQEPYMGEDVDGMVNGDPPSPWSVACSPTELFTDEVQQFEVPHTCHVTACHACGCLGWVRCHSCLGRGYKRCITCQGTGRDWKTDAHGHRHVESCWQCHGNGRKRCLPCGGDGRIVCKTCQGYKQLKFYIRITITYTNHHDDHLIQKMELPQELVKDGEWRTIFEQTESRVWPISDHLDQQLCSASNSLLDDHWSQFQHTQIVMQRHILCTVPISECTYTWREEEHRFWVNGNNMAVYAPDYPQTFCWGCTIL